MQGHIKGFLTGLSSPLRHIRHILPFSFFSCGLIVSLSISFSIWLGFNFSFFLEFPLFLSSFLDFLVLVFLTFFLLLLFKLIFFILFILLNEFKLNDKQFWLFLFIVKDIERFIFIFSFIIWSKFWSISIKFPLKDLFNPFL